MGEQVGDALHYAAHCSIHTQPASAMPHCSMQACVHLLTFALSVALLLGKVLASVNDYQVIARHAHQVGFAKLTTLTSQSNCM